MERSRHMHIASCVLLITCYLCTVINGTLSTLKRRQAQCPCDVVDTYVDCSGRSLDNIPSCIPVNVIDLNLRDNRISHIEDFAFARMHNLNELVLWDNQISHIKDFAFAGMHNLYNLDLRNNRISHIEDFAFAGMHNLYELDLHSNNLTTITRRMLGNLTNVKILYLHDNKLKTIPRETFADLTSIRLIDLRHNVGLQIHDVICAFKHKDGFLFRQYPGKFFYNDQRECSCHYVNIQRQFMSVCKPETRRNSASVLWNNSSFCSTLDSSIMSLRCKESYVSTSSAYRDETTSEVSMSSTYRNKTTASSPENTDLELGPIIGSVCAIVVLIAVIIVVIVIVQKRRVRRKSVTKPYESTTPPRSESEKSSSKTNSYSEAGELDPTVRIDEGADDTVTYTIPGAPGAHPRSTRSTAQRSKRGPPQAVPTEQAAREEQPEYIEIENETRHNGEDGYLVPTSQYASLSPTRKSEEGHEYEKFGPKPTGSSSTTEYSGLIKSTKREKHLYDVLEKKETKQTGETGKQDPSRAAVVKKGSGKTSSSVKS